MVVRAVEGIGYACPETFCFYDVPGNLLVPICKSVGDLAYECKLNSFARLTRTWKLNDVEITVRKRCLQNNKWTTSKPVFLRLKTCLSLSHIKLL